MHLLRKSHAQVCRLIARDTRSVPWVDLRGPRVPLAGDRPGFAFSPWSAARGLARCLRNRCLLQSARPPGRRRPGLHRQYPRPVPGHPGAECSGPRWRHRRVLSAHDAHALREPGPRVRSSIPIPARSGPASDLPTPRPFVGQRLSVSVPNALYSLFRHLPKSASGAGFPPACPR